MGERMIEKKTAIVGLEADGWGIHLVIDGEIKRYGWNHNDEDMGTDGIRELLKDLGIEVTFEEWY